MESNEGARLRRLPGGQHGIPRELVERNQRERLIAAMAEVCAERGYAATSVADIARRAAVSTASFYRQFEDKQACLLVSFEELFGRLLEAVERACEEEADPEEKLSTALRIAAELLGGDIPTARLLTVEIVAGGPEGVRLQHTAIDRLATRLRESRGERGEDRPSPSAEWTAVAAMVALVAKRAVRGEKPVLSELKEVCALL